MPRKMIGVSKETYDKIVSVQRSYELKTLGEAITYCVNRLFEDESEIKEIVVKIQARDLVGFSIDKWYKWPAMEERMKN